MLSLGLRSLANRRVTALLTVVAIALSVALILGVERLRTEARAGFTNSVAGVDMIVASRGNSVQILMATVFGVGSTSNTIGWGSYEMVRDRPDVAWAVPVSMGDNHRGAPVIGTTAEYFEYFRHSGGRALAFADGAAFASSDGAVVGADVAERFGYGVGSVIVNAHGAGEVSFDVHDEAPFTIAGVLEPTGTATDRMVFVSLEGFDQLHEKKNEGPADPFMATTAEQAATGAREEPAGHGHDGRDDDRHEDGHEDGHDEGHNDTAAHDETHGQEDEHHEDHGAENAEQSSDAHQHVAGKINAILLGLRDRSAVLSVQRNLSEYPAEPLTAVLPNVTLLELWSITGTAENALRLMAGAVAVAGMLGMVAMLFAALEERRREFAILRSVGATPLRLFGLIVLEAALLTAAGIGVGLMLLYLAILVADPILASSFGLRMGLHLPGTREGLLICVIFAFGLLASLLPAYRVFRMTLSDGLTVRL